MARASGDHVLPKCLYRLRSYVAKKRLQAKVELRERLISGSVQAFGTFATVVIDYWIGRAAGHQIWIEWSEQVLAFVRV